MPPTTRIARVIRVLRRIVSANAKTDAVLAVNKAIRRLGQDAPYVDLIDAALEIFSSMNPDLSEEAYLEAADLIDEAMHKAINS